jgi:3-methyl-2-oxobutanoate hydroxymethyltransferase
VTTSKRKPLRIQDIQAKKVNGEKITMLTAYSAWMGRLLAETESVDMLLVGDSLGMVELGYDTTLPVTVADIVRHTKAVRAGAPQELIVADMPFLSHQVGIERALSNAGRLLQLGGASAVKLEGSGAAVNDTVHRLVAAGIPVMGHLGMRPQFIHAQGGFRRQAKQVPEQEQLVLDGLELEQAGAFALVIELVPDEAAAQLTAKLRIPVIGIGAGAACDGQVLVTNDLLGLTGSTTPSFAKQYAALGEAIRTAVGSFSDEVRRGVFPATAATGKKVNHA